MYIDDYATCAETHASLGIFSDDLDSEAISRLLGLEPTEVWQVGQPGNPRARRLILSRFAVWFLRTRGRVESRDLRRHLDWLLDRLQPRREALATLQARGCQIGVCCFWLSRLGQGGPSLSPPDLARLASLGLEVWFDVDYVDAEEAEGPEAPVFDEGPGSL